MPGNNWMFGRAARRALCVAAAQTITAGVAVAAERIGTVDRYSAVIGGFSSEGPFYAITAYAPYEEQGSKFLGLSSILQTLNACFHGYRYEGRPIAEMWYEQRADTTPQQALDLSVREIQSWGEVNKDISFGVGSTRWGRVNRLEQCIISTVNDNLAGLYQPEVENSPTSVDMTNTIAAYIIMGVAGMGMLIFLSLLLRSVFKQQRNLDSYNGIELESDLPSSSL